MDPPSCRLLCPQERYEKNKNNKVITIRGETYHVINSSYCISDDENEISNHLHSLLPRNKVEPYPYYCVSCSKWDQDKIYYFCNSCNETYHKECVESPFVFQSSEHPRHPLQLVWYPNDSFVRKAYCFSCKQSNGKMFYYCFICDFLLHSRCATNPTPLIIDCPKRHEHTLHYFPRNSSLVCDVCGSKKEVDYLYVCLRCDFIVHKSCLYLPYVIKVSRHDINHRLAFTPHIPYKEWSNCGVCHQKVDGNHGKYSCTKGCGYAVHTRCALRGDVWDGIELEGQPEVEYVVDMYKVEGDGIIRHSGHPQHQLKRIQGVSDDNKHCQMCILPFVDDGNVYQCMQCDFALHESCAYMPRVKQFMLHAHPLILETQHSYRWIQCWKCRHYLYNSAYVCQRCFGAEGIDIHCASISEPFVYHSHPHPLFINCDEMTWLKCSVCKSRRHQPLSCGECDFVLCFRCATLPNKARYEHDAHLLTFFYDENRKDDDEVYCCEICEKCINPKKGLYGCNECGVALHIDCLRGEDPYLKPGQSEQYYDDTIQILANTCSARPICKGCGNRCLYKIKIESHRLGPRGPYCSFDCYTYRNM